MKYFDKQYEESIKNVTAENLQKNVLKVLSGKPTLICLGKNAENLPSIEEIQKIINS